MFHPKVSQMPSVKVLLNKQKGKVDGSYPIVIQIIKDRKKKIVHLGYYIKPGLWDARQNLPTLRHPNSTRLKNIIRTKLYEAERIILDLEDKKRPFTIDDIIVRLTAKEDSEMLFVFAEKVISRLEKTNHISNAQVYRFTLNMIKQFRNFQDISLKHIDVKFLYKLEEFLMVKGCMVNSISLYMRTFRAIYNRAIKESAVSESLYPFRNFTIHSEETRKRAIPMESIEKIMHIDLSVNHGLIYARDLFLFSFYMMGMSLIDIAHLRVEDINGDRMKYSRKKTKQKFSIKIPEKAWVIIKRYNDLSQKDSYIFPILKREGMEYYDYRNTLFLTNKKLKKLCTLAEIPDKISTYTARHSWATIAKRKGVPTAVISEGLGHESEKTTQIYLDSFENETLDNANELIIN